MSSQKINLFSSYYKAKFGKSIGKIALGTGEVCPNRSKGGCIYCAPASFTPYYLKVGNAIAQQLEKGEQYLETRKFRGYFSYFQQETSTAAPFKELAGKFKTALSGKNCVGLIISTRPDYLDSKLLEFLNEMVSVQGRQREIIIEVGLQSAHDRTLSLLNRNHSYEDFVSACKLVKQFGNIQLGVHLIVGLPGEDKEDMCDTVKSVCSLGIDAIKFHHLQVIENTRLHQMYLEKPFKVYTAREYCAILAELLAHVPTNVVVHRLWSSSDPKILVAPDWGGLGGHQLKCILEEIMEERGLYQGMYADGLV